MTSFQSAFKKYTRKGKKSKKKETNERNCVRTKYKKNRIQSQSNLTQPQEQHGVPFIRRAYHICTPPLRTNNLGTGGSRCQASLRHKSTKKNGTRFSNAELKQ